ncbi:MAG: cysteine desulfurase family protein [Trueperaceae bacterium]
MIYLDYAATTPLDPLVLEAMLPYMTEHYGNVSSLHTAGQKARRATENAREQIAAAIGAKSKEIIFTSGATEADNQAIRSVASLKSGGHILTSSIEHAAVLATGRYLETLGHPVTYLAPNQQGEITPEAVAEAMRADTVLVALMRVNNETGIQTDIATIARHAHERGVLVFCDAVQAFGFEDVNVRDLDVDMLSLSAHKVYGPKGVGVLYVREGLELPPFILGGEQERGFRAGTHNTPGIIGMGRAAELAVQRLGNVNELTGLRDAFEGQLLKVEGVVRNGNDPRGPKHVNIRIADVDGEALLLSLDRLGVCASAGSACAAGSLEPSHVLTAMGLTPEQAKASLRFSLGRGVNEAMLKEAAEQFAEAVKRCRVYA